jgi:LysM repeat protein
MLVLVALPAFPEIYRVRPNDNLTRIAEQFGTTPLAIARANKISIYDVIVPGQVLTIPEEIMEGRERFISYKVRKGDRLSDLSARFGVPLSTIARDNNLTNANRIRVGQLLKIRQSDSGATAQLRIHRVDAGESLSSIADEYGTSVQDIVRVNSLKNANLIQPGQLIRIPSGASGKVINPYLDLPYEIRQQLELLRFNSGKWQRIMIHHTATDVGSFESIDRFHREKRGMVNGMAYHFLIGNGRGLGDGEIVIGPRWKAQLDGGHTAIPWLNATSIGICLVGNFEKSRPTSRQLQQLSALSRFLMAQCGIPKSNLITHKIAYQKVSGYSTVCPGRYFSLSDLKDDI